MKHSRTIIYIILIITLLVLWEKAAHNNIVRVLISSPSLIIDYFGENITSLGVATGVTFIEAASGLLIATIFSFLIMIICFYFPKLMDFIMPVMVISQVIPLITLAPLFIILFGAGISAKVLMAALLCFFPIFVNFANGVKLISPNIHELLFISNATITQKIRHAYFPLSLPYIMSGLKIAATLALIGAIVGEFTGAEVGIGKNLFISALRLEPEKMMCSLLLSAAMGTILFQTIVFAENLFGKWYISKSANI